MVVNNTKISKDGYRCLKCGHEWIPNSPGKTPRVCPQCKSAWWDQPKRQKPNIS